MIHLHHRQPRAQGGSNRMDDLCLLHLPCRQQVHSKQKPTEVNRLLEPYTG
ncbi:MAG: HNH endonuclease [Candidatus Symbiodolus clandestinus]